MRNLVIDIGNTRVKYGLFLEGRLETVGTASTLRQADIFELATNQNIENIIYSSVAAPLPPELEAEWSEQFYLLALDEHTALPFVNDYATPATLGKDRLAAVAGARYLYPQKNCLVVDAGTCITLDVLTADGVFLGGNISPGVQCAYRRCTH